MPAQQIAAGRLVVRSAEEPGDEAGIRQPFLRRRALYESRGEPVSTKDHFTVSISSLNNGLNDDRRSLSGHTLTIAPDGRLSIETYKGQRTFSYRNNRLRVPLRAANDRADTGNKFGFKKRLGEKVVSAEPQSLDLVFDAGETREYQNWGSDSLHPQRPPPRMASNQRRRLAKSSRLCCWRFQGTIQG
jgi:hypothetical protein